MRGRPSPAKGRPKDKADPSRAGRQGRGGKLLGRPLAQVGTWVGGLGGKPRAQGQGTDTGPGEMLREPFRKG